MLTLVVGGAASGKSAYAEELILHTAAARRIYLATMLAEGEEARRRIEKHRAMRAGKGFETIECSVNLSSVTLPPDSAVLLEDMGNLCANELFSPDGCREKASESVLYGIVRLREQCRNLVIVSNEVFTDGIDYMNDSGKYLSLLSCVNRKLAETADAVCEVSCGIPMYYKGEEA